MGKKDDDTQAGDDGNNSNSVVYETEKPLPIMRGASTIKRGWS